MTNPDIAGLIERLLDQSRGHRSTIREWDAKEAADALASQETEIARTETAFKVLQEQVPGLIANAERALLDRLRDHCAKAALAGDRRNALALIDQFIRSNGHD